jgi:UDPglucose 6-dehydrogenase
MLNQGNIPIYEPGLEDLIQRNSKLSRLSFTTDLNSAVKKCEVIFIAVGTPQDEDGSADLTHVITVAKGIGKAMNGPKIVVDKSTVPVGTAKLVKETIEAETHFSVDVVSNPEFLKEGTALDDFLKPDRVVIGVDSEEAQRVMVDLYEPFTRTGNPIIVMDVVSAEMTKYAANTMLAIRVSFMNEIALLCEKTGANINSVRNGIGSDSRIGKSFLFPGIGYGGSCFPKDVQALVKTGKDYDVELLLATAAEQVNFRQKRILTEKIISHYGGKEAIRGKKFAVWGLAFKPRTDDVREAPAMVILQELLTLGATIEAYDPEANGTFQERFGEHPNLHYGSSNYEVLTGADALIVCTEWNEFRAPAFSRLKELMKDAVIFDGRNIFARKDMKNLGFTYYSIGRPSISNN